MSESPARYEGENGLTCSWTGRGWASTVTISCLSSGLWSVSAVSPPGAWALLQRGMELRTAPITGTD